MKGEESGFQIYSALIVLFTLMLGGLLTASASQASAAEVPINAGSPFASAEREAVATIGRETADAHLRFEVLESTIEDLARGVAPLPLARFKSHDARWGLTQIGVATMDWTACVPSSFASVLSAHGIHRSPVEVATLMHEIGDYNRDVAGAGGYSVVAAAQHFDLDAAPLKTEEALTEALRGKHPVIALLSGPSTLALPGTTHAVALSGLENDQTLAVNPGMFDDAWFTVSELWANRSTLAFDEHDGAVFWAIR